MKIIYLSPHLDDAVFSCGGWIWEQTQRGLDVEIWTICAGDPPQGSLSAFARTLHRTWNLSDNATQIRRDEDSKACQIIGAESRHFPFPDCIYRKSPEGEYYYASEEDIFGGLDPREADLIDRISADLGEALPPEVQLFAPLGIGNHVDHEIVRKAAARLERDLHYYADYPYARTPEGKGILSFMEESREWQGEQTRISEKGLDIWWQAAQAYRSQISTFWEDDHALRREIIGYSAFLGGFKHWIAPEEDN